MGLLCFLIPLILLPPLVSAPEKKQTSSKVGILSDVNKKERKTSITRHQTIDELLAEVGDAVRLKSTRKLERPMNELLNRVKANPHEVMSCRQWVAISMILVAAGRVDESTITNVHRDCNQMGVIKFNNDMEKIFGSQWGY